MTKIKGILQTRNTLYILLLKKYDYNWGMVSPKGTIDII